MRRVITYGTFDTLHYGHIRLLHRARELEDHLTVALSTDEFNEQKCKRANFDWERRKLDLEGIRYVDDIISEDSWDQKVTDVVEYNIDVFAIGEDWHSKFDFLKGLCEVVYLPRTPKISSTVIRSATQF